MSKPRIDSTRRLELRDPATRRHLADAMSAVMRILNRWAVRREDHATLLGLSPLSLRRHHRGETLELAEAQVTRMSLITSIFQSLHRVFPAETADAWITRRNGAPPFLGHTPLTYALRSGLPGLFTIRQELDLAAHGSFPTTQRTDAGRALFRNPTST